MFIKQFDEGPSQLAGQSLIRRKRERSPFLPDSQEPEFQPLVPMSGGPERLLRDGGFAKCVTERAARDDAQEQGHHEVAGLLQEVGSLLQTAAELAGSVGPGVIFESIMALASSTGYTGQSRLVTLGAKKARLETGLQFAKGDRREIDKAVLAAGRSDRSLLPNLYSLGRVVAETNILKPSSARWALSTPSPCGRRGMSAAS